MVGVLLAVLNTYTPSCGRRVGLLLPSSTHTFACIGLSLSAAEEITGIWNSSVSPCGRGQMLACAESVEGILNAPGLRLEAGRVWGQSGAPKAPPFRKQYTGCAPLMASTVLAGSAR